MNEREEYNAAFDGRAGADRMARGLPSVLVSKSYARRLTRLARNETQRKLIKSQPEMPSRGNGGTVWMHGREQ